MDADLFMVFDVESVGLHGDGFAVGWVVVNRSGEELDSRTLSCAPGNARGDEGSREWLARNVEPGLGKQHTYETPAAVRHAFWCGWLQWAEKGAMLAADVAWPVEARFLAKCVDDVAGRDWLGPYPLIDIASVRLGCGLDPLAIEPRRANEEPAHHPLADARQSARLLIEALPAKVLA